VTIYDLTDDEKKNPDLSLNTYFQRHPLERERTILSQFEWHKLVKLCQFPRDEDSPQLDYSNKLCSFDELSPQFFDQ